MSVADDSPPVLGTRVVERPAVGGQMQTCDHCGEKIKFVARLRKKILYANIYEGDRWDRLEYFHPACYLKMGAPYGAVDRAGTNQLPG